MLVLGSSALAQPTRLLDSPDLTCEGCEPAYLRMAIETAVLMGAGVGWYWYDKDLNSPDWDFPGLSERLDGSAIRFDNNTFTINNLVHPFDGGAYYLVGRTNRLGVLGSSMLSIFASTSWEYILEWREKVSINDLVFTPGGGIASGEFLYQLAEYLNSAPGGGNWAHKAAAGTLGFPVALHRWMDGAPRPEGRPDALGFGARFGHRFLLAYTASGYGENEGDPEPRHGLVVEAKIASLSGYQKPRRFTRFFANGNFTELALRGHFADAGAADVEMWVTAVLAGVYSQNYARYGDGLTGNSARVGVAMALEHTQRWLPPPQDRIAAAHLPGLSVVLRSTRGTLGLELDAAVHPDLAAVDSLGWHAWEAENPDRAVRTVLTNNDYYFAFGVTTWGALRVWWGPAELGGRLRYGAWDSVDGYDRFEEEVHEDVALSDQVMEMSAWTGWRVPGAPVQVKVSVESVKRSGTIDDQKVVRSFERAGLQVGLLF